MLTNGGLLRRYVLCEPKGEGGKWKEQDEQTTSHTFTPHLKPRPVNLSTSFPCIGPTPISQTIRPLSPLILSPRVYSAQLRKFNNRSHLSIWIAMRILPVPHYIAA